MPKHILAKYILPLSSLLILFYILWSVALPYVLKTQIQDMLDQYGFAQAEIGEARLYRNVAVFKDIRLEPEGGSTIGTLSAHYRFAELFSDTGFEKITVDNLTLYGEIDDTQNIRVAGWRGFRGQEDFSQHHYAGTIELRSAVLDLLTPAGGIRLEAEGQVSVFPDGDKTVQLYLRGKQHQLQIDTIWNGRITKDGAITFEADIRNLRLRLEQFNAARVNGWATIEQGPLPAAGEETEPAQKVTAGQLMIGGMNINGIGLNEATLTFDQKDGKLTLFADAEIAGHEGMGATIEINRSPESFYFSGIYTASAIEDFMDFSDRLHESLSGFSYIPDSYKNTARSLIAMEQTRDDVRDIIRKNKYDRIEFALSGPADRLDGKITARYSDQDKPGRHVIRLMPPPAPAP